MEGVAQPMGGGAGRAAEVCEAMRHMNQKRVAIFLLWHHHRQRICSLPLSRVLEHLFPLPPKPARDLFDLSGDQLDLSRVLFGFFRRARHGTKFSSKPGMPGEALGQRWGAARA
jgi:hypothetical protein